MKGISLAFVVAGFAVFAQSARADDGLDVTMQVLDDVSGIDAVLLSVDAAAGAEKDPRRDGAQRSGDGERHTDDGAQRAGDSAREPDRGPGDSSDTFDAHEDDALESDLDEHSEAGIEDADVPREPLDDSADGTDSSGTDADTH